MFITYQAHIQGQTLVLQHSQSPLDDCLPVYVLVTVIHLSTLPLSHTQHFRPSFARHVHI